MGSTDNPPENTASKATDIAVPGAGVGRRVRSNCFWGCKVSSWGEESFLS